MRFEVANNGCVGDVFALVLWYVIVVDDMEGVGTIDPFSNALGPYTNTLAQAVHFVGVRSGLDGRKAWVLLELLVRKVIDGLLIKDRHCPHAEECLGKDAARR